MPPEGHRCSVSAAQNTNSGDLILANGKFVDGRGQVATTLTVRNGRIASVGKAAAVAPDARTIDLGGRTVVPGLFDGHVHYTRAGVNPGYEARRIERAFSIAELQEAIASERSRFLRVSSSRASVAGTTRSSPKLVGRRKRNSTRRHPNTPSTFPGTGGGTGAITNSLGAAFFAVEGRHGRRGHGRRGSGRSRRRGTPGACRRPEDKLRGTADLNAHANSLGLTGVINAGNLDDQEFALRLWRENKLTIRMRPLFPADSPQDVETRVLNNFSQGGRAVGDDLFRVAGFGERIGGTDTMSPQFEPTARMIAKHGWLLQQHSITIKENDFHLQAFQSIAREHPIDKLRWSIIHLQSIDEARLKTLKDLGAGASAQTWTVPVGRRRPTIPPHRRFGHTGRRWH